jgi:recombination protein RecT
VKVAYDDVDPRIWPLAKRSLLAHVDRVRELGLAHRAGETSAPR